MREIDGFDNYLIDENGNIFSKKYKKYISKRKNNQGYYLVDLYKNNVRSQLLVHRLVAQTFIKNPYKLPCINHKDECKTNNCISNLEWCSYKYNMEYSNVIKKANNSTRKKVAKVDKNTNEILDIYNSRKDAERDTRISNSLISECCNHKRKTAGGFKWKDV